MTDMTDCPDYLEEYIYYLRDIKNRSEHTIESYYIDLRLFLRFLKLDKLHDDSDTIADIPYDTVAKVTLKDVYAYLSFSAKEQGNNEKTRARKVSSIKGFYNALCGGKIVSYRLDRNPVQNLEKPKLKKSQPKYLGLDDSKRLVEQMDTEDPFYKRDFCILMLFLNCGMRLSELVGLNVNDIDFKDRTVRVLGKGNKERILHLNEGCARAVTDYLEVRGETDEKALFLSKRKKRIGNRRVEQIVDNAITRIGMDGRGLSTHKLRHTAATLMYQYGNVDPMVLKEILGHASVSTTEIYTHLTNDNVRTALDANPMSGERSK
ncbi:MAG: tyrosine recombinase XerC [Oscillospiraceae bacterium]|nr:tyrosine recombinase XerC [Oscillospiraceae bacterium]